MGHWTSQHLTRREYGVSKRGTQSRTRRDAQHFFTSKLRECRRSLPMLCLGLTQQFSKRLFLAEWVEPGITGHGGKTEESAGDDAFEKIECRTEFIQMSKVPRQVIESLGIAEIRGNDTSNRSDAFRSIAFK